MEGIIVKLADEQAKQHMYQKDKEKNPADPSYHKTNGDKNMSRIFKKLGPDERYLDYMARQLHPESNEDNPDVQSGRDDSAKSDSFLVEKKRPPERKDSGIYGFMREILNYSKNLHKQRENPLSPEKIGEKKEDDAYNGNYMNPYNGESSNENPKLVVDKKKSKNLYLASITDMIKGKLSKSTQYFKKDYKTDFSNEEGKTDGLYEKSIKDLSNFYDVILKGKKYLASVSYGSKPDSNEENNYMSDISNIVGSYVMPIGYAADNDDYTIISKNAGTLDDRVELLLAV